MRTLTFTRKRLCKKTTKTLGCSLLSPVASRRSLAWLRPYSTQHSSWPTHASYEYAYKCSCRVDEAGVCAFLARRRRPYLTGFVGTAHSRWSNTPFWRDPLTHVAQVSAERQVVVVWITVIEVFRKNKQRCMNSSRPSGHERRPRQGVTE